MMFDQSGATPGEQSRHADALAYAFYRRALARQSEGNESEAVGDLKTALQFPSPRRLSRTRIRHRLSIIQKAPDPAVLKFEGAVARRFGEPPSEVHLLGKFLRRFGLSQAKRSRRVRDIDEISSVGVYRWVGDTKHDEQWSRLIRAFKKGESALPGFFGRVLAEHVRSEPMCKAWTREVDCIVPVPAAANRTAERGIDIVADAGKHLSSRLGIPIRTDFLKRSDSSERSRFVSKADLASQYSFNRKKTGEMQDQTVLLLDDVVNRGHTAGACASLLREFGCRRVVLLVLAIAESSLQSGRHADKA